MSLDLFRKVMGSKKSRTKYKCASQACETTININKTDSKYCEFHTLVHKHHIILVEHKDPLANKTQMYMYTNGEVYNTQDQMLKVRKELEAQTNKYKK